MSLDCGNNSNFYLFSNTSYILVSVVDGYCRSGGFSFNVLEQSKKPKNLYNCFDNKLFGVLFHFPVVIFNYIFYLIR